MQISLLPALYCPVLFVFSFIPIDIVACQLAKCFALVELARV